MIIFKDKCIKLLFCLFLILGLDRHYYNNLGGKVIIIIIIIQDRISL